MRVCALWLLRAQVFGASVWGECLGLSGECLCSAGRLFASKSLVGAGTGPHAASRLIFFFREPTLRPIEVFVFRAWSRRAQSKRENRCARERGAVPDSSSRRPEKPAVVCTFAPASVGKFPALRPAAFLRPRIIFLRLDRPAGLPSPDGTRVANIRRAATPGPRPRAAGSRARRPRPPPTLTAGAAEGSAAGAPRRRRRARANSAARRRAPQA